MSTPAKPAGWVVDRLHAILIEQLGVDDNEIQPAASLWADLGADSLDLVDIALACEEEFDIEYLDDADLKRVIVAQLVQYLETHLATKGAR